MFVVVSPLYARAFSDCGCKTLRTVLKSVRLNLLYPKLNHSGGKGRGSGKGCGCGNSRHKGRGHGKSRSKAKQKAATPQLKDYPSLLLLMVIISVLSSTVDVGEARRFSGRVVEGVYESAAGNAIGVC